MQLRYLSAILLFLFMSVQIDAQHVLKGKIIDAGNGDPLIGASIIVKGTNSGNITDYDGYFEVKTDAEFPMILVASYLGYVEKEIEVLSSNNVTIALEENSVTVDVVEVKASRISEANKKSPLTIEALDNIAIKETPASDFYSGLGALKGVDLTAASLGFKVVNTRGFNSTSPVRSLQIIDGVDNQAPGLNFSLGNFLGSSELDVNKVEIIVGASSAFYGPNAFNGVISMETKDPFFHKGLSASVKVGERNMLKTAVRFADAFQNKQEDDVFAYKLNLEYLRADDWVADNYDPVDGSDFGINNPGGFDAVNTYGDEYQSGNDFTDSPLTQNVGLGGFSRTGYNEIDLVDYDTRNFKANASFHFKTKPSQTFESPEIVFTSSFGGGTTVYQGDNRFSLKGITFFQNKLEYRKLNKFFIRAYATTTTAGDSYDPYFTALKLLENGKPNREWQQDYLKYWLGTVEPKIYEDGYPTLEIITNPDGTISTFFDVDSAENWLVDNNSLLAEFHSDAAMVANGAGDGGSTSSGYFVPGTAEFEAQFNEIVSSYRDGDEGGTRFYDKSSLYHIHGEYKLTPLWTDEITIGSNARIYAPDSRGTIFGDRDTSITNREFGVYAGISKSIVPNKLKAQGAIRLDKNDNFDALVSPAASLVFTPSEKDFFRVSFSSAIRNPTLSDQYLNLDVGRAILAGNIDGRDSLITVESFRTFVNSQQQSSIVYFDVEGIQPEKVKTFEVGFRTTLFEKLYVDAGYYYSIYDKFIGYQLGIEASIDQATGSVTQFQAYRFATNSNNTVTTQGAAIGLNYYFAPKYSLQGNYSWNKLNTEFDDPIIPAFNTPEHKYNIGINGRDISPFGLVDHVGFNINYKWIEGFIFEGSPQFTGIIPTYDMLDAQVNIFVPSIHMTFKLGASNILDSKNFQTYGGPRIGRLGYFQLTYDMGRKK
jgi:iron complex outermembrane receptor protein